MLKEISNWNGSFKGAYNIRENGCSVGRQSSENIKIDSKTDQPGLDIHILPGTKGETVSIPACVTHGDVDDLVYNDFYVGEGADVIIVAGCGVHTETGEPARHNGIHRFFLAPNSHVKYVEKHIGTGKGFGIRTIDPVTEVFLEENAVLEMDTAQIGGVDRTTRKTKATVAAGGKLLIRERILTEKEQTADTEFEVELNGEDSSADIVSRSVARDASRQSYVSTIVGNAPCSGHSECDAIIDGTAVVDAAPKLWAHNADAALIHEAAIGKIAGEQILKLRTLGLTEEEAEKKIIEGFLS
ncbi:MAG TPA: SufD family Fe-S cluster assembly protein [Candidatus Pullilachnospira gallistercoris]|uniref:SufD family Fe-S cluster assembly protein n=1 Tax=Candidatus Pullilachnospira gallistercoris TaxID=2840911 RepID=A0A9D1EAM5_9FIRM|nr:SufD family Fe-S cluster assembly protein [Candidatus Pullilachnospira gallistercoris]